MHAHHDIFGIITEGNVLAANALATSVGINLSQTVGDTIIVDFASPHVIERVDRLSQLHRRPQFVTQHDVINHAFAEGRAIFLIHFLESAVLQLRGMEQNYGLLPLPKFNEQQESYVSYINAWNCAFVGIPSTADYERSAFLMEAMAYASYRMVRPYVYDVKLHNRAARDEESERMIDIIIETSYLDLNGIYNWGGVNDILGNAIFTDAPLVSQFEARIGTIEGAIDRFIETLAQQ
jgi:hypothetical protein